MELGWIYWFREQVGFTNAMKAPRSCISGGCAEHCKGRARR